MSTDWYELPFLKTTSIRSLKKIAIRLTVKIVSAVTKSFPNFLFIVPSIFNIRVQFNMKILLYNNKQSILLLVALWILSFYYLVGLDKGDTVLWLNGNGDVFFDDFFLIATKFGEPVIIVLICIVMLVSNWKKGILLSGALILNTIIVQLLKKLVFADHMRPLHYLQDKLSLIEGLAVHSSFSFPSGHTTGGFTLFFMVSLLVENKIIKCVLIFFGVIVAISRVYLSQHFLEDVVAASVLSASTCVIYYILFNKSKFRFI